jgi:hypothetical protein
MKLSRAPLNRSSGLAMVEAEHPTEAAAPTDDCANTGKSAGVLQQLVPHPLMIALTVVVGHVLRQRVPQRCLSEEDHPAQAFFLDQANESLRKRKHVMAEIIRKRG